MNHDNHSPPPPKITWWDLRIWVVFLLFLLIAGFFLFAEHRAHLYGVLQYVFLILFFLLHFFMHSGHGHGHDHSERKNKP